MQVRSSTVVLLLEYNTFCQHKCKIKYIIEFYTTAKTYEFLLKLM